MTPTVAVVAMTTFRLRLVFKIIPLVRCAVQDCLPALSYDLSPPYSG
jgi:hypothetical protein